MTASVFASKDAIPTDVVLADFYETGQLCVCVYFEEEVCNAVVFTGTYNSWSDVATSCTKFEPVEGYAGWYVVAVTDESTDIQGKPVQLKSDGAFSWDYQTGDENSWELKRGTVTISAGYSGESNLTGYSKATPVVLVSKYFKNHNSPCGAGKPQHTYTVILNSPSCADVVPAIIGDFNSWATGVAMEASEIVPNQYTATFKDEEGHSFKVKSGANDDWSNEIVKYNADSAKWFSLSNTILTADSVITLDYSSADYQYQSCVNIEQYTLLVNSTDFTMGSVSGSGSYTYGTSVTITATPNDHYHFVRWSDGDTNATRTITVTANATYTAEFAIDQFTVSFKNYDGTVLQSSQVDYGTTPSYTDQTPTKAMTAKYTYTFKGWNPSITSVTGNATYIAVYDSIVNKYTITFKNEDGTILQSSEVAYDQVPTYDGVTPTKQKTAKYTYSFKGWSPTIVSVTGEATYKAEYDSVINKYMVIFQNDNGATLQTIEVEYDQMPVYTGVNPTKQATTQYTYTFAGWDPAISPVVGNVTYKATYTYTVNRYTITLTSSDAQMGSVEGGGTFDYNTSIVIYARSEYGYTFSQWSDDNTDNPRKIVVTADAKYTAQFIVEQFVVWVASADYTMGTAFGSGEYDYNTYATLKAVPNDGYTFDKWDDDNTDNPRVVHVTEVSTYIAYFKQSTALDEVSSSKPKTQKVMIDGHLYIFREGVVYNAIGGVVNTLDNN